MAENLGRVNFGKYLLQNNTAITHSVTLIDAKLTDWKIYNLTFGKVPKVALAGGTAPIANNGPMLRSTVFLIATPTDTYLGMRQWGYGMSKWLYLGRYWATGPQQTLYVPADWLKKGQRDIIML